MSAGFSIGSRAIGLDAAPYIIAEAGVHHNNDLALARELIDEAAGAGADAIKFQTYDADLLAAAWAPAYWQVEPRETQHTIFSGRSRIDLKGYEELFSHAASVGITLLSTPFDVGSLQMLRSLGMAAIKIASADITFTPLLDAAASSGLPIMLSTGASTFEEVRKAVGRLERGSGTIALLHCVLSYPTPVSDANLSRIVALQEQFPAHSIGYSDHTRWDETELACPAAVACGAVIVEKHFTLDRGLQGDDHYHAVDPVGLRTLVDKCREAAKLRGTRAEILDVERAARELARRSVMASRPLKAGTRLSPGDIAFKRPGTGLPPDDSDKLAGRRLRRDLAADELIMETDVE
jgi:sialic acid synthase SpsE